MPIPARVYPNRLATDLTHVAVAALVLASTIGAVFGMTVTWLFQRDT